MNPKIDADSIARRMKGIIVALAVVGSGLAGLYGGWRSAIGFALGAGASYWNFRNLTRIVSGLGLPHSTGRIGAFLWILFRFAVLSLGAFVIIRFTQISVNAALTGLLVSAAAVILESIFELTYAR